MRTDLGCDDILNADRCGEFDSLHDFGVAVYSGVARFQQPGMCTDGRGLDAVFFEETFNLEGVIVKTDRRGKTRRSQHAASGVGIGYVGVVKSHFLSAFQLLLNAGKRLN